jgi:hypothetical protein
LRSSNTAQLGLWRMNSDKNGTENETKKKRSKFNWRYPDTALAYPL